MLSEEKFEKERKRNEEYNALHITGRLRKTGV